MNEGEEVPIHLVDGPRRAWLSLSGTILTYRDGSPYNYSEIDIPIEWIRLTTQRMFYGARLVKAFAFLLIGLIASGVIIGIPTLIDDTEDFQTTPLEAITMGIVFLLLLITIIYFFTMFILFFRREMTIGIQLTPNSQPMQFWFLGRQKTSLATMVEEILARQSSVRDQALGLLIGPIVCHEKPQVDGFLSVALGVLMPGPVRLWLLLVGRLYERVDWFFSPSNLRLAMRSRQRRDWQAAAGQLEAHLKTAPNDVEARMMLIEILARQGRFDEAGSALREALAILDRPHFEAAEKWLELSRQIWKRKTMPRAPDSGYVFSD